MTRKRTARIGRKRVNQILRNWADEKRHLVLWMFFGEDRLINLAFDGMLIRQTTRVGPFKSHRLDIDAFERDTFYFKADSFTSLLPPPLARCKREVTEDCETLTFSNSKDEMMLRITSYVKKVRSSDPIPFVLSRFVN